MVIRSLLSYLSSAIEEFSDEKLKDACRVVINHFPFQYWPASTRKHHAHFGGLVLHTKEVVSFVATTSFTVRDWLPIDKDIIIASAIWHDFGKCWDYTMDDSIVFQKKELKDLTKEEQELFINSNPIIFQRGKPFPWQNNYHHNHIRHVARSYSEWMKASEGIDNNKRDAIGHCILSHHGRKEYGSPVEPQTPEAHFLHYADMMSSRFSIHANFDLSSERSF